MSFQLKSGLTRVAALLVACFLFVCLSCETARAKGPTLTTLHTFNGPGTYGAFPFSTLVAGRDGLFYGTTDSGGLGYGTLFQITAQGRIRTLFRFNGLNGSVPRGALVQDKNSAWYGTTQGGGRHGAGTLFRFTVGGPLTTLVHFAAPDGTGKNAGGSTPQAGVMLSADGTVYGTAGRGGRFGGGTLFAMTTAGKFVTLHEFSGPDGLSPVGPPLMGADGSLYGVTYSGGTHNAGTVFRMTLAGRVSVLHSFDGMYGAYPFAGLTAGPDGAFYGTTYAGGLGYGTLFHITPSGAFTTLHKFSQDGHGTYPFAGLTLAADGNFYGVTAYGGSGESAGSLGYGTVFQMTPAGQTTSLYKFHESKDGSLPHGSTPFGAVAIGPDGLLYGTTAYGGTSPDSYGDGTVYRLAYHVF